MARVPTWTELRIEASNLTRLQNECNRSAHDLLYNAIPELDKKLIALKSNKLPVRQSPPKVSSTEIIARKEPPKQHSRTKPDVVPEATIEPKQGSQRQNAPTSRETVAKSRQTTRKKYHKPNMEETPNPMVETIPKTASNPESLHLAESKTSSKFTTRATEPSNKLPRRKYSKSDLEGLEHLKPLPLTPSDYLKLKRPDLVYKADRRVMHLKKCTERRKILASEKRRNALEQIDQAPKTTLIRAKNVHHQDRPGSKAETNNNRPSGRSSIRSSMSRDSLNPSSLGVFRLTEREMKRRTASVYNKLPEVKQQRTEETKKFNRAQLYKDKLEYGRTLNENRRHGIINYPLMSNYDQRSLVGSQDDSLISSGDRSSDGLKFESYPDSIQ